MKRQGFFRSRKVAFAALLAIPVIALGVVGYKVQASTIQDCTVNSIIKCGEQSPSAFISRVRANNPSDLQAIYSDFGLVSSDYSKFVTTARSGVALRNGNIVVDGQIVATNASSIGRQGFSYSHPVTIAGKTYFSSANKDVLNQDLPVMVMFNSQGVMQFAVMNACGNPTTGTKVTPRYSCDLLQKTAVSGKLNTYNFTTKASASSNAKVVKVVYNFGDGTTATSTNPATPVQHTYAKPGTFTAQVTVYVSLPGNQTVTVTSANCKTTIVVSPPIQECVALTAFGVDVSKRQYRFTATTKQSNGSTLQSASFDFGDNTSAKNVGPASATTVVTNHTYATAGDYTITSTVNFNTISGVKSATCTAKVTAVPEACPINPSLPKDSPKCKPCELNPTLPVDSPLCQPPVIPPTTPPELPNTGVGSVVGIFGAATVAGVTAHRLFLSRRLSTAS